MRGSLFFSGLVTLALLCCLAGVASGAHPTAQQALQLKPVQDNLSFDQLSAEEVEKCRVEPIRGRGMSGWTVYGPSSQMLRRFVDSNGDDRIDQWCYYENGIETYRDIDSDFNGKAEQYRWLGTAGSRWGLDPDEDGCIDSWKSISPEEVTAEVIASIRDRDSQRFQRVLLNEKELSALGLGSDQAKELLARIKKATTGFSAFVASQDLLEKDSEWVHFGATRPGVVPGGTAGSTKDLLLYDHAAAIVETKGKHEQVVIGTLVRFHEGWRVIDLPRRDAVAGLFFTAIAGQAAQHVSEAAVGLNREMQDLLGDLEKADASLEKTTDPGDLSKLNAQRADVLEKLAVAATAPADREAWTRQFADTVSAAVQSGDYPQGVNRLKTMVDRLQKEKAASPLVAFVKFRSMTADYGRSVQQPEADFAKIQANWLKQLQDFVKTYPKVEDAAEAMLQLAIAQEFAGKEKEAGKWYGRVVRDFGDSRLAEKAAGAKRRLESVGKSLTLTGSDLNGSSIDLKRYRGNVVLIHYWATWCEPCKQDMKQVRALQAKFATSRFTPIGVNVDHEPQPAKDYVNANRITWPQLHEEGGLDSRLANELGILTLPTMLLIDRTGRVVRRNIHAAELEGEIKKLVK
jgi:thiol-disulfide isomerase/thioredoxin